MVSMLFLWEFRSICLEALETKQRGRKTHLLYILVYAMPSFVSIVFFPYSSRFETQKQNENKKI